MSRHASDCTPSRTVRCAQSPAVGLTQVKLLSKPTWLTYYSTLEENKSSQRAQTSGSEIEPLTTSLWKYKGKPSG